MRHPPPRRAALRALAGGLLGALVALAALAALGGCATRRPADPAAGGAEGPRDVWSGRLALRVVPDGSEPQSFSAGFELRGSARAGELALRSPLGSTLAQLQWQPGQAVLRSDRGEEHHPSLEALTRSLTQSLAQALGLSALDPAGTAADGLLPLAELFDWLRGPGAGAASATASSGWQLDESRRAEGRLAARRTRPEAELRLILDR